MKTTIIKIRFVLKGLVLILFLILVVSCSKSNYGVEYVINTGEDIFDYTIEISNGQEQVRPKIFPSSAHELISTDGDYTVAQFSDGFGVSGFDMVGNLGEIPSITQTNDMDLILSDTITYFNIEIYNSDSSLIDSWKSWEDHSNLEEGQYFIVLSIHNEIGDYYANEQCLFVLTVN